jgi:hypothetical protein
VHSQRTHCAIILTQKKDKGGKKELYPTKMTVIRWVQIYFSNDPTSSTHVCFRHCPNFSCITCEIGQETLTICNFIVFPSISIVRIFCKVEWSWERKDSQWIKEHPKCKEGTVLLKNLKKHQACSIISRGDHSQSPRQSC